MTRYRLGPFAGADLAEVYRFSRRRWGAPRAESYVQGLFALFDRIAASRVRGRSVPTGLEVIGRYAAYESHHVYWDVAEGGLVVIRAVLHQSMDPSRRLREAFAAPE